VAQLMHCVVQFASHRTLRPAQVLGDLGDRLVQVVRAPDHLAVRSR
jgi:hypothetical protein